MPDKTSAGVLMYYHKAGHIEVLLVHPGGPLWRTRDEGAWSIPKGEPEEGEDLLTAAMRELQEETGIEPQGDLVDLGWIKQRGGKSVRAWALEVDPRQTVQIEGNTFEMEWPPHSGRMQAFPEIDRAEFFPLAEAEKKINQAQRMFLERLSAKAGSIDRD
ncbi:MAG: NUDIX domain-containing protein [Terrimicrobiaceae bacterium]